MEQASCRAKEHDNGDAGDERDEGDDADDADDGDDVMSEEALQYVEVGYATLWFAAFSQNSSDFLRQRDQSPG